MKKIYLLTFNEFDNDCYTYFFENKEWFDWIFTNEIKPLQSMTKALFDKKSDLVYYKISTLEDAEKFLSDINPNSGSFENDKALLLRFCSDEAPDTKKELVKWLVKNNYEIEDEYEGLIY